MPYYKLDDITHDGSSGSDTVIEEFYSSPMPFPSATCPNGSNLPNHSIEIVKVEQVFGGVVESLPAYKESSFMTGTAGSDPFD